MRVLVFAIFLNLFGCAGIEPLPADDQPVADVVPAGPDACFRLLMSGHIDQIYQIGTEQLRRSDFWISSTGIGGVIFSWSPPVGTTVEDLAPETWAMQVTLDDSYSYVVSTEYSLPVWMVYTSNRNAGTPTWAPFSYKLFRRTACK